MTQAGLGLICGMGKSQISRIEKGVLGSPETYNRLLTALGYRIKIELVDETQNESFVLKMLSLYKEYNSEKYGLTALGLFGSYARGEQGPDSDIDICVSLKEPSLYKYSEIRRDLSSIFNREIDLVPLGARMSPEFSNEIKKDLIYV